MGNKVELHPLTVLPPLPLQVHRGRHRRQPTPGQAGDALAAGASVLDKGSVAVP